MKDLYIYMKKKLEELQRTRSSTIEIDCVEFMQMMKVVCYMMQIRRIVDDDA